MKRKKQPKCNKCEFWEARFNEGRADRDRAALAFLDLCEYAIKTYAMLSVMAKAIERTQEYAQDWEANFKIMDGLRLRQVTIFTAFFHNIDLILAASSDTLCGSKWINAAALLEARKRYAEAMEKIT